MIQAKVNNAHYEIDIKNGIFSIDGKEYTPDFVKISDNEYHLLLNNKGYRLFIRENANGKNFEIEVNGNNYEVSLKDAHDLLLDSLGMSFKAGSVLKEIKAPMPGLVIDIMAKPGDEVQKDTPLLILEAMKMENIIKSPGEGVIDKVLVHPKDAVDKGQVLLTFK